uniref:T-complex protein 1 subunit theta n=1 Tax=Steinernema glaseri TaxID=37863 RepID=A0A1I7YZB5_9BILA
MVFKRGTEGSVKKVDNARIAVFACPVDITQTETKGTILMNTAADLKNFASTEEEEVEAQIKSLADAGVNVVVANGKFGDIYLHFLNKHNMMAVRLSSKFDLRRLARSLGAQPQSRICTPSLDLLGQCSRVYLEEIGDTDVTVFEKDSEHGNIATIIVRGSSQSRMDDVERAIDDAVNTYKALTKDDRLVAGAGAIDMRLSHHIEDWGMDISGTQQYGIKRYALALSELPKQLAMNNGHESTIFMSKLISAHRNGNCDHGIDLVTGDVADAVTNKIYDVYLAKLSCYRLATEAVSTILRVDQIIMAKQATGGPKPRNPLPQDGDDDGMA